MAQANIDVLAPKKSIIDLGGAHNDSLDGIIDQDYELGFIFDDIILVEFIDEVSDGQGEAVLRGGVYIPTNSVQRAWRKAKVILAGPECKYTKVGDIVMFPNDKGASVSNMEIDGYGRIKNGMFLNEQRLFGICKRRADVEGVKKRLKAIAKSESEKAE